MYELASWSPFLTVGYFAELLYRWVGLILPQHGMSDFVGFLNEVLPALRSRWGWEGRDDRS